MMSEHDEQLVAGVRDSDEEAFRRLFERYQPVLFRAMFGAVRDRDEAHEIVQQTFVRVWDHRRKLNPDLPILGFLLHVARNLLRDAAKRADVRRRYEADVPGPAASASDDPERSFTLRQLEEAISEIVRKSLPDKCREVFLLSRLEGWSNAEVARQLGISVKTVENQITKALRIVREGLSDYR